MMLVKHKFLLTWFNLKNFTMLIQRNFLWRWFDVTFYDVDLT